MYVWLLHFKNNQLLLNKINHRLLLVERTSLWGPEMRSPGWNAWVHVSSVAGIWEFPGPVLLNKSIIVSDAILASMKSDLDDLQTAGHHDTQHNEFICNTQHNSTECRYAGCNCATRSHKFFICQLQKSFKMKQDQGYLLGENLKKPLVL